MPQLQPNHGLHQIHSRRVGLAFSGGSVRGIAHIGVVKALTEAGIEPCAVAGTSVGSIIGLAFASGMNWQELISLAHEIFWPSLLNGYSLERFCSQRFPRDFADLRMPFAAVATVMPGKRPITISSGRLATAISASCAIWARRRVHRDGYQLKDGGFSCVMPAAACRELGAEFVIASDVWATSAFLRRVGLKHDRESARFTYPRHYLHALENTDLLIQPAIPFGGYMPSHASIDRVIAAGEAATHRALANLRNRAA